MEQMTLASNGFGLLAKLTRKREFQEVMNLIILWTELLTQIAPYAPTGKTDRPAFLTEVMQRILLIQQFFGHFDRPPSPNIPKLVRIQRWVHHVNIHALNPAVAGVMPTILSHL